MFNDSTDIIIFALITAFLLYKLYSSFGTQNDKGEIVKFYNSEKKPDPKPVESPEEIENFLVIEDKDLSSNENLTKIGEIDKSFSVQKFCSAAEKAFEIIVNAYDRGDKDTLKNLVSKNILKQFTETIEQNKAKDLVAANTLVAINSCKITSVDFENKNAKITVKYSSQQIHLVKNLQGNVVEGDPSQIDHVEDTWVYSRNLSSSNPNWLLIDIK